MTMRDNILQGEMSFGRKRSKIQKAGMEKIKTSMTFQDFVNEPAISRASCIFKNVKFKSKSLKSQIYKHMERVGEEVP